MSILSKVHAALCQPTFESQRDVNRCYPSAASAIKTDPIWGQQVIGACLRAEFYRMTGVEAEETESYISMRRMGYGNPLADWEIQQMIAAGFTPVAVEHPVNIPYLRLSGRVDVIIWDPFSKEFVGIEQKTTSGRSAQGTVVPDYNGKLAPKPEHVLQTVVYAHCMRDSDPKISRWKIIYYDRATCKDAEHDVLLLDDGSVSVNGQDYGITWEDIENRFRLLVEAVDNNQEPARDFQLQYDEDKLKWMHMNGLLTKTDREQYNKGRLEKGDKQCYWCKFKNHCYRAGAPD